MAAVLEDYLTHPCHCVEISGDEYKRVAGLITADDRMKRFAQEKEELKKLSDERIKKWPNTLKNLRENRVQARKARLEKEEEERRKQDVLDATFRAKKRREQLEKSNFLLLRPHIKELQFKAMMREILKEREEQTKCKAKLDEAWKRKDKWWHEMLMDDYRRGVAADKRELQRRTEVCKAIKQMQTEQLEERKARFRKEREDIRKEGQRLKKLADENDAADEERDRQKKQHQIQANLDFKRYNIELQARRDAEKEKLKLLDEKIRQYVAMKEKRDADNQAEKDRIQNEKNARRDYMIDKLAKHLMDAKAESDRRLGAEAQEARIAEDMREVLAAERRRAEWNICDRSRQQQIRLKNEKDERDRQDTEDTAHQVWQRVLEVQQADEAEFERVLKQNQTLANHHLKQAEEKKVQQKQERQFEIDEARNNWRKMQEDDEYIKSMDIFNQ